MDGTYYANLTRGKLSEKLDGSSFTWPTFVAGDTIQTGLRFSHRVEGKNRERSIVVSDFFAAISRIDLRPDGGTFRLKIGPAVDPSVIGTNVTAELDHTSTATDWQTALNALSEVGTGNTFGEASVTLDNGTFEVVFDGEEAAVPINISNNKLTPCSVLRTIAYEKDGVYLHACRLIEAPVAFTTSAERVVPAGPTIERHRLGSDVDGETTNEIQILTIPPEFEGAFEFERNGLRSRPLNRNDSPARILEVLEPLADTDGEFLVDDVLANEAWIEFSGSMEASAQDLLTVHVVRAPEGDLTFDLDLDKGNVFELLREEETVDVYLHIKVLYESEVDSEKLIPWSYLQKVKLTRPVIWEGLDVDEAVDFLKIPADRYPPYTPGQVITGTQHYSPPFPGSSSLGTTALTFTHNLDEDLGHIVVAENAVPGVRLIEGTDYTITTLSDDQFRVDLIAGGYFQAPIVEQNDGTWEFVRPGQDNITAQDAFVLAFSTIGPKSAFVAHEHVEEDIPTIPPKFADIFARLAVLEAAAGQNRFRPSEDDEYAASWAIPEFGEVFPRRGRNLESIIPGSRELADLDPATLPSRDSGLLPAVHDAAAETMLFTETSGVKLAAAVDTAYRDRVFENQSGDTILLPGGLGRSTTELLAGEFAACDGRVWYRVVQYGSAEQTSYYPQDFERELFFESISANELVPGRRMETKFSLDLATFRASTKWHWVLAIEIGTLPQDTTPATPGTNLQNVVWSPDPVLEERIVVGPTPRRYEFGYRVDVDAEDEITAFQYKFGAWPVALAAPATREFAIRVRLYRGDTENREETATGFLGFAGPRKFDEGPEDMGYFSIS